MKKQQFLVPYTEYDSLNELHPSDRALIEQAISATSDSYAPYSRFSVGAALRLTDGTIVCGSNQENAAYPSGLCAERTALFYAGSRYPNQKVEAIAIAARNEQGQLSPQPITPCGACRQVMQETALRHAQPIRCLLYGTRKIILIENALNLLPLSFSAEQML